MSYDEPDRRTSGEQRGGRPGAADGGAGRHWAVSAVFVVLAVGMVVGIVYGLVNGGFSRLGLTAVVADQPGTHAGMPADLRPAKSVESPPEPLSEPLPAQPLPAQPLPEPAPLPAPAPEDASTPAPTPAAPTSAPAPASRIAKPAPTSTAAAPSRHDERAHDDRSTAPEPDEDQRREPERRPVASAEPSAPPSAEPFRSTPPLAAEPSGPAAPAPAEAVGAPCKLGSLRANPDGSYLVCGEPDGRGGYTWRRAESNNRSGRQPGDWYRGG